MGLHYTRKKDGADEKTVTAADFMERLLDNKRNPDVERKEDRIESTL